MFCVQVIVVLVTAFNDWSKEKQFRGLQVSSNTFHISFTFKWFIYIYIYLYVYNYISKISTAHIRFNEKIQDQSFVKELFMFLMARVDLLFIFGEIQISKEMHRRLKIDF